MATKEQFVLTLLHSVTNGHILHFQAPTLAIHEAMGKYYSEIGDLVDDLTECMQGKYGVLTNYPTEYALPNKVALDYMVELNDYVYTNRKDMPQDSELQNIIDEIAALIDRTVYLLRFVK